MDKDVLTPYYVEHKITKKGKRKRKKPKERCPGTTVAVTLDINQLLSQCGEEVQRRTIAEMQLYSIQMRETIDALDVPFEEVNG